MAQWIEEKFIGLIGHSLPYFRKQSGSIYTFRCPFCGDSKKKANKTRGYFFLHNKHYWFKCHNCNESMSFSKFLKLKFSHYYDEYQLDRLREREPVKFQYTSKPVIFDNSKKVQQLSIPAISELPETHQAVKYCNNRMLPKEALDHLYFTDSWTDFIKHNNWTYSFPEDRHPRLVLPWFNSSGAMLGAQVRRIDVTGKEGRYITLKDKNKEDAPKIYGVDRLDYKKPIYIVEGPLDSWFVPNCVAAMGSDLEKCKTECLSDYDPIFIYDNEPRNINIVRGVQKSIDLNHQVVIWPSDVVEKDINDMVKSGLDVMHIIKSRTFRGLRAKLEFTQWKKIDEHAS